ncbi:MAG: class I SAM-dependent methyltransferase [Bacteroidetes bacterium]|nr:class I SAM-dependent methyltransferase [Bacteroidota bacterium]
MNKQLINKIDFGYLLKYPGTKTSPIRVNQDTFLSMEASSCVGKVIEIGAEDQYNHQSFFNNGQDYFPTNISKTGDNYLDVTAISLPDNSVDNYLCVSVLEHVKEINKAITEIHRTLKPGGKILLVIPFGYAVHDKKDYWRMAPDGYVELFHGFKINKFYHFGGTLSTCAVALQRPKGKISLRYFLPKMIGWFCLLLSKYFETVDDFPQAFGLVLEKK